MSELREKLIRLANANPEMRKHLVPLLREGAYPSPSPYQSWQHEHEFYLQQLRDAEIWMWSSELQKNGNYKCLQVSHYYEDRGPQKAKWVSADVRHRPWKKVSPKDVPPKVMARFTQHPGFVSS